MSVILCTMFRDKDYNEDLPRDSTPFAEHFLVIANRPEDTAESICKSGYFPTPSPFTPHRNPLWKFTCVRVAARREPEPGVWTVTVSYVHNSQLPTIADELARTMVYRTDTLSEKPC